MSGSGFDRAMMRWLRTATVAALSAVGALASADDAAGGNVHVSGAWARATPPVSEMGAAYLSVANRGAEADRLIGASSPVAERAELHGHSVEAGMMTMRALETVELRPGETVVFAPGGNHVMLIGLTRALRAGERFPLTLELDKGESLQVEVRVLPAGAAGPDADG